MHMYTKYEVSMFNPVMGGGMCTDNDTNANDANANDDGQSMIF